MFHSREIAADRQRRNIQAQMDMKIQLSERRMQKQIDQLDLPEGQVSSMSARDSSLSLQQARMRAAKSGETRQAQNALRGEAMHSGTLQLGKIARIEGNLGDEPSLEDQGRAHLARAQILKENAFELNRIALGADATGEAMMARRAAQSSLAGAIGEELHGVASLEGRDGIAARTGLEGEKLDALVARSGIKSALDRHAAENAPAQKLQVAAGGEKSPQNAPKDPADYWVDLESRAEPKTFETEVFRFRAAQIKKLYGAPDASAEKRATFNAMRKMHVQAHGAGPTSGQALRVNQKLVADLPEDSDERKAMVAIRGIALERRKRERQADNTARS